MSIKMLNVYFVKDSGDEDNNNINGKDFYITETTPQRICDEYNNHDRIKHDAAHAKLMDAYWEKKKIRDILIAAGHEAEATWLYPWLGAQPVFYPFKPRYLVDYIEVFDE